MKTTVFLLVLLLLFSILLKKVANWGPLKSTIIRTLFLFTLLRFNIHTRIKLLSLYYWTQTCRYMKPPKTCVATRCLISSDTHDVDNYACGALNDFHKPCGAQRFIKILRSWRCLLLCLRHSQRFQQTLRSSKTY